MTSLSHFYFFFMDYVKDVGDGITAIIIYQRNGAADLLYFHPLS